MTALEQTMANNKKHFYELNVKPMFSHCIMCTGAMGCYNNKDNFLIGHPNFLDADCYKTPMLPDENTSNN